MTYFELVQSSGTGASFLGVFDLIEGINLFVIQTSLLDDSSSGTHLVVLHVV